MNLSRTVLAVRAIAIADGRELQGHLPRTANKLVQQWLALRRPELEANWRRAQVPDGLEPIEPLE